VFLIESAIKIMVVRLIEQGARHQTRHVERLGARLHGA
jgi:hypothetical protein